MDDAKAEDLLRVMRDVRFLLWISTRGEVASLVAEAFDNEDQRKAFKLLSEGKSYREIGSEVGSSHTTVGDWVKKWRGLGLVQPDETELAVDPETLGI